MRPPSTRTLFLLAELDDPRGKTRLGELLLREGSLLVVELKCLKAEGALNLQEQALLCDLCVIHTSV